MLTWPFQLGETIEVAGAAWVVWGWSMSGQMQLAKVPEGETVTGMGRTWQAYEQEQRFMQPEEGKPC
jgi:hypothetical protein